MLFAVHPTQRSFSEPLQKKSYSVPLSRRRKKYNDKKLKNDLTKIWTNFCTETAMVGLRYIGGKNATYNFIRFIWIILWLSQFGLCCWLSGALFMRFIKYEVKTTTTYQHQDEISFPAITICNQNLFRRTVIGGDSRMLLAIAMFFTKDMSQINRMIKEDYRFLLSAAGTVFEKDAAVQCTIGREYPNLCSEAMRTEYTNTKTCSKTSNFKNSTIDYLEMATTNFMGTMDLIARDSGTDVVGCWWQSKKINCSNIFSNQPTDYGWCYTFNQEKEQSDESSQFVTFGGYGLNDSNVEYILKNAGKQNGFRMLLTTGQDDYCGSGRKYFGAGFYAQIHDRHTQPQMLTRTSISLHPGFSYSISLKPTSFRRYTEHLGHCLNYLYVKMYPNYNSYFQMLCLAECVTTTIWKKCGCFPTNFQGKEKHLAKSFGLNENETKICGPDEFSCMHTTEENSFTQNTKELCPDCKVACYETFYEYEISNLRFPSDHLMKKYTEEMVANNDSIRKNYVNVNLYLDSMTLLIVEESQAVTAIDLMTSFGWTMSLFLGSSFLSPFEFFHALVLSIVTCFKYLCLRNSVDVVRQVLYG